MRSKTIDFTRKFTHSEMSNLYTVIWQTTTMATISQWPAIVGEYAPTTQIKISLVQRENTGKLLPFVILVHINWVSICTHISLTSGGKWQWKTDRQRERRNPSHFFAYSNTEIYWICFNIICCFHCFFFHFFWFSVRWVFTCGLRYILFYFIHW